MDLKINECVEAINSELARALSFEDKFAKFISLGEVANLTNSNKDVPSVIKARILKRIKEEQEKIAYCDIDYVYPNKQEDLDEDLRHEDMENPIAIDVK